MNRTHAIAVKKQKQNPNLFIFEYDYSANAKKCVLWTFDQFFARVSNQRLYRVWHECIWAEEPCRIYFDCEMKGVSNDTPFPSVPDYVAAINAAVKSCLIDQTAADKIEPPFVLNGSRPGTFSLHLVWHSVGGTTTAPILAIVSYVASLNIMGVTVDVGVVPSHPGVPHTLRMPYSGKLTDRSAGLMLPQGADPTFNAELFCKGLVTFHRGHSTRSVNDVPLLDLPPLMLTLDDLLPEVASFGRKRSRVCDEIDIDKTGTADVTMDCLQMLFPGIAAQRVGYLVKGGWKVRCTMYCDIAKRWHNSNEMYIRCNDNGELTKTCADSDCRVVEPLEYSESETLASARMWNIDWAIVDLIIKT